MAIDDPTKPVRMRLQRDKRLGTFRWNNPHSRPSWWDGTWTPDDGGAPITVNDQNSNAFIRDNDA